MASVASLKSVQTVAEDDGIREAHGLYVGSKPVVMLSEQGNRVVLIGNFHDQLLAPRQARYLARKLCHLARRIEKRELVA